MRAKMKKSVNEVYSKKVESWILRKCVTFWKETLPVYNTKKITFYNFLREFYKNPVINDSYFF